MTDDNAAIAATALESLRDKKVSDLLGYDGMLANATIAQVHATLALTEQQRIANVIAWRALKDVRVHPGRRGEDAQIEAALGIEPIPYPYADEDATE